MKQIKITEEMTFLKCFDEKGNLIPGDAFIEKKGICYILRIGSFKQVLSERRYKMILALTGATAKEVVAVEEINEVEEPKNDLASKPKAELLRMTKELYADGQVDGRLSKEKLIDLIEKAKANYVL